MNSVGFMVSGNSAFVAQKQLAKANEHGSIPTQFYLLNRLWARFHDVENYFKFENIL